MVGAVHSAIQTNSRQIRVPDQIRGYLLPNGSLYRADGSGCIHACEESSLLAEMLKRTDDHGSCTLVNVSENGIGGDAHSIGLNLIC
jgi:hypothetical protein